MTQESYLPYTISRVRRARPNLPSLMLFLSGTHSDFCPAESQRSWSPQKSESIQNNKFDQSKLHKVARFQTVCRFLASARRSRGSTASRWMKLCSLSVQKLGNSGRRSRFRKSEAKSEQIHKFDQSKSSHDRRFKTVFRFLLSARRSRGSARYIGMGFVPK